MTATSGAAGFSLNNNPDTIKDVVQNVINNALTFMNVIMVTPGSTAFHMFIKPLSELYLIFGS